MFNTEAVSPFCEKLQHTVISLAFSLCFYSLEINFVHLESCLKDTWSQNSAPQQILVKKQRNKNRFVVIIKMSHRMLNDYTANLEQASHAENCFCVLDFIF